MSVVSERSDDRCEPCEQQVVDRGGIDVVDIAHEAVIDAVFQRSFMAAYHIHVGSSQSDGVDAERLQAGHEFAC